MDIARSIVNSLEEKKGERIVLIDIQKICSFADYFVICSGTSDRMLNSLAESVLDTVKKDHKINGKKEGNPETGWVVCDCGDVVVHLFSPEQRDYYQLEDLWNEGKVLLRVQ